MDYSIITVVARAVWERLPTSHWMDVQVNHPLTFFEPDVMRVTVWSRGSTLLDVFYLTNSNLGD